MEIKGEPIYFENMSEVEVFQVLSNCLKSELNQILETYQEQIDLQPQEDAEEINERKDLLKFLMTTKDKDELNTLNLRFEELGCADDKYCEAISSTSVILSRIVVKIIEASEKSIEYLKQIRRSNSNNNNDQCSNSDDNASWFSQRTDMLSHSSGHSSKLKLPIIQTTTTKKAANNTRLSSVVDNIYKRKTTKIDSNPGNEDNVFVDTHNFSQRIDCEDYEDYDEDCEDGEYLGADDEEPTFNYNEIPNDDQTFEYEYQDEISDSATNNNSASNNESRVKLISLIGRDGNKFKSSYLTKVTTINNNRIKGNRKMYFCQSCSFKTVNIFNLKKHLLNHNYQKDSIKCRYCEYYASNSLRIKHHEMLQHPDTYQALDKVETEKKIHSCKMCPYKTNNITQLKKTHLVHHQYQEGFYKCRYCQYYVVSMSHLSTHEMIHAEYENRDCNDPKSHSMKVHYCKACPYKTIKTSALKQHVRNHEYREASFKCRYCDYFILKMKHMRAHEELHMDYKPRV